MSLRGRLSLVAGLAVAIAVAGATVVLYAAVRSELRGEIDDSLRQRARVGETVLLDQPPPSLGQTRFELPRPRFGGPAGYFQFVGMDGRVEGPPAGDGPALPVDDRTLAVATGSDGGFLADEHVDGTHLRMLVAPAPEGGAIQIARPLTEVDSVLNRLLVVMLIVAVVGVAAATALGTAISRAAFAPVSRFTRRTEELTSDPDLSHRLEVKGGDELARLARSYNATLDALERSAHAQRRLVADASHELRTPLASLRTNFELLGRGGLPAGERKELLDDVVEQIDELTALVGDIVELAEEGGGEGLHEDVRLDELVGEAVERSSRLAPRVSIEAELEPCLVAGVTERIQRAVGNLLDNACKWSPAEKPVEVRLAAGELSVRDHGPGFEARDLPFVFDRFYRANTARRQPGSGLGLAIVRQVAEAHGGWARAANAPGGGALLRVSFGPVRRTAERSLAEAAH
jgi:two-component system, OmpR family, sensor histidine kinase MprB